MVSQEIHQNWKFRKKGNVEWLNANVPGCVHTDLIGNKLIPDPFFGSNVNDIAWIEKEDWEYSCEFNVSSYIIDHDKLEIWFYGIDTYAEILINGQKILETNNMFHPWSADVKSFIHEGNNTLEIIFSSPYKKGLEKFNDFPYELPAVNDKGEFRVSPFTRKAAYHYGWDWAPRILTSGIWKNIELIAWNKLKIRDFDILQDQLEATVASLSCELELDVHSAGEYIFTIYVDKDLISTSKHRVPQGISKFKLPINIYNPKLWFPKGYGSPDVYKITVDIKDDNQVIDTRQTTTGLRIVELIHDQKNNKEGFLFRINGQDIYAKGANIIPPDYFVSRTSKKDYELLVENAVAGNMNMLRVWGGAIYENDYLYNLCNKEGIMIWQDFMFACMMYPSDAEFQQSVRREIEYNIKRLRNHPSLVIWCGNNEILEGYHQWGWKENLGEYADEALSSYEQIFLKLIPETLKSLDNSRPYWPSSPSAGYNLPPEIQSGDFHYWDVIKNPLPLKSYQENVGRFMSEFGFKSYPELNTIKFFTEEKDRFIRSEVLELHQGWPNGTEMVERHSRVLFGRTDHFENAAYFSQLVQKEALKLAIEAQRRSKPYCMGSVFWQLNDCWPCASWSAVDYFGKWKALMYELKHLYSDTMVSSLLQDEQVRVFIASDLPRPVNLKLLVSLVKFDGQLLFRKEVDILTNSSSSEMVFSIPLDKLNIANLKNQVVFISEIFEADKRIDRHLFYFLKPVDLLLTPVEPEIEIEDSGNKTILFLKSPLLLKNVHIQSGESEGFFSDNFFDLLPGENKPVVFQHSNEKQVEYHFMLSSLNSIYSPGTV